MLVKLAIIGIVLLGATVLVFPETLERVGNLAPKETQPINEEAKKMRDNTANELNGQVENTISSISEKASSLKEIQLFPMENTDAGQDVSHKTDDNKEKGEETPKNTHESTHETKSKDSKTDSGSDDTSKKTDTGKSQSGFEEFDFENLSLVAKQDSDGIKLSYRDISGETSSVKILLKDSEGVVFSGEFNSSGFDAIVSDVRDEPHLVEFEIKHQTYGTLTSAHTTNDGTEVEGIFKES